MVIVINTKKLCSWLTLLSGFFVFGCSSGPQQQGIWPWQYGKDFGRYQTGDYVTVSGSVAQFGEPPKAAKPVTPEAREAPTAIVPTPAETVVKKTDRPDLHPERKSDTVKTVNNVKGEYDFRVADVKSAPPSYLPLDSVRAEYDITAFNHGNAPVSVTIDLDPTSTYNVSSDKGLPLAAVIPPHLDQAVLHLAPKMKNEAHRFRYSYGWSIGDYTASHHCPEHYQFPFGNGIRAFASVGDPANSAADIRYAVVFSMPAGTPVRAARNGAVIRIMADDRIDILHDDSTIATYSHLGHTDQGLFIGKAVKAGDIIGIAGAAGNRPEAYLQLAVWRPELRPVAALTEPSAGAGFDILSFPMEFCSEGSAECKVLSQNQPVSRNKMTEVKKPGKRTSKPTK